MGEAVSPPQYQKPPDDPALAILKAQNEQQQIDALQNGARMDTARLMAIYGTRLALGGTSSGGSPLVSTPAPGTLGMKAA